MGFVITDIISQNEDYSDEDVIEVVRDEASIEIISDDEDTDAPQNMSVIQNYHFLPPLDTAERKDSDTQVTKDPLDNLSQSTDSDGIAHSPNAEELLLTEPLPPGTEEANENISRSIEANGTDAVNNSVPIKLPANLATDSKVINENEKMDEPNSLGDRVWYRYVDLDKFDAKV